MMKRPCKWLIVIFILTFNLKVLEEGKRIWAIVKVWAKADSNGMFIS